MKLGKCKQALADLINANCGWVDGEAIFAAMDGNGDLFGYSGRPQWTVSHGHWYGHTLTCWFFSPIVINNHHQTILSREEYYHAYPKADDDGWIEWNGGECPVDVELYVYVNYRDGCELPRAVRAGSQRWDHFGFGGDIVSYRLRNHANMRDTGAGDPNPVAEPEFCESVMRCIQEPESHEKLSPEAIDDAKFALMSESIEESKRKPTIEQLAQDYRNKLDFAKRKQQEADDAKAAADAAICELERAGEALGLLIGIAKADREPELVITNWRDLNVGDLVEVVSSLSGNREGEVGTVTRFDEFDKGCEVRVHFNDDPCDYEWCVDWKFIRRP